MKIKKFKSNVVKSKQKIKMLRNEYWKSKKTKRKGEIKHEQQIIKIEKQKNKTFVP